MTAQRHSQFALLGRAALLALCLAPAAGAAQAQRAAAPAETAAATPSDAAAFCASISEPAAEARFAWQAETLKSLEAKLQDTLRQLNAKKAELQTLTDRQDTGLREAESRMTEIFSRMRPDAAALQLAAMDPAMAVALLGKLPPRSASAVLNEMETARAAQLAEALGGRRPPTRAPQNGARPR